MLRDILTMCWKEWREYLIGRGGSRFGGGLRSLALILIFGAFIPFSQGVSWASSPLAVLFDGVYFPLILVLTVVADSFAGERERHTLETLLASRLSDRAILLGKFVALTIYGWLFGLLAAIVGIVVANIGGFHAAPFFYTADIVLGITIFSLLSSALMASAGCLVSLRAPTIRQAQQTLSTAFAVLFFGSMIGLQFVPTSQRARLFGTPAQLNVITVVLVAALVLLLVDVALVAAALTRFRRDRLMLD